MIARLRSLMFALVRRILLAMTKPEFRGIETLPTGAPMVYVLAYQSLTDLAMLDIATERSALPRPRLSLAPFGIPERQRYFFLARPIGRLLQRNLMKTYPPMLLRLQTYFRYTRREDLCLVPVSVFWSRAPAKERSFWRIMLSENWTITSRFRRLVVILFNRRDITVLFGAPLKLSDIDDGAISEKKLVRRIARMLRVNFKNQRTALLGPDLSHRRTLVRQIAGSRSVREAIRAEAERTHVDSERIARRARKQAYEIASDVSYTTIRLFERLLAWFFTRVYAGVDVHGIERVKKHAETATLIYVPSHRSHVDYLVLSYVLYEQGLTIPHIAAGENLDMPIVGAFLRRGGAFFMRRRFADDRLYSAVFNEYLFQVFRRGSPVEYFIEGGRSRTGRPLPPRTGLLNMTLASQARGVPRPLVFVPVYIGYEKLIEAKSYVSELSGAQKKSESIFDVLRTLRIVGQRFGRIHVNIGEPLPCDEFLARTQARDASTARRLGVELVERINAAADANAINLIALGMLSAPRLAMDAGLLAEQLDCYAALLRADEGAATVTPLSGTEMIAYAEQLGMLLREQLPFGDVMSLGSGEAVLMTWYRNNVVHRLALPALIACLTINRRRPLEPARLARMVGTVYPYLARELYIGLDTPIERAIDATVARLVDLGLLTRNSDGALLAPQPDQPPYLRLGFLAEVVMPILERFFIVIVILEKAGIGGLDRTTLEQQCQDVARRVARLHGVNAPEFFDARLFHGFVDTLIELKAIAAEGERIFFQPLVGEVIRAAGTVLPVGFRNAVLRARIQVTTPTQPAAADPSVDAAA